MTFAFLTTKDIDQIVCLQQSCFPDGWDKQMFLDGFNSGNLFGITAKQGESLCGFITYSANCDFAEINDILVSPDYRKQGLGKQLLQMAENQIQSQTKKIFLEVRESNFPAINLYKSQGFTQNSIRKKYYQDGENALVMLKEL